MRKQDVNCDQLMLIYDDNLCRLFRGGGNRICQIIEYGRNDAIVTEFTRKEERPNNRQVNFDDYGKSYSY